MNALFERIFYTAISRNTLQGRFFRLPNAYGFTFQYGVYTVFIVLEWDCGHCKFKCYVQKGELLDLLSEVSLLGLSLLGRPKKSHLIKSASNIKAYVSRYINNPPLTERGDDND